MLRSLYAIIAAPVFAVVLFLICCPLIVALPRLQWRRAMGRLSVRLSLGAIGVPIRVHGRQHLPQGPSVAVANHTSYLDGLVLTAALPGTFTFMVQDGAARWPVVGFVLRRMGVSFVNRTAVREGARQTRALLKRLIEECERRGFRQMVAVIGDSAQVASIEMHRALGFRPSGNFENVGYKFGRWLDSVMMQRDLGPGATTKPQGDA